MGREIIIGNCSTTGSWILIESQRLFDYAPPPGTKTCRSRISENGRSYSIEADLLGMRFLIAKDTEFGKSLAGLLERKEWDAIDMGLDDLVMVHATPSMLRHKITEADREGYDRGYEEKAAEFRKVLGIRGNY